VRREEEEEEEEEEEGWREIQTSWSNNTTQHAFT
jgi:hypothetical protein